MSAELDSGLSFLIGLILVLAGVQKMRDPRPLQITLRQLYPSVRHRGERVAGRLAVAVACVEIVVGLTGTVLRGPAGLAASGVTLVLCCGFLLALRRALRVGANCSCFGRLSRTAVGGRELGRAVALLAVAATTAGLRVGRHDWPPTVGWPTILAIACGAGVVLLATGLGERLRPAGDPAAEPSRSPGPGLREVIGFDGSLYATAAARLHASVTPTPRLAHDALRVAAGTVRAAPETSALLAEERAGGCGAVLWHKANAAVNPGTGLTSVSIPTDGGCLLVARLGAGQPPKLVNITVSVPRSALSGSRR